MGDDVRIALIVAVVVTVIAMCITVANVTETVMKAKTQPVATKPQ